MTKYKTIGSILAAIVLVCVGSVMSNGQVLKRIQFAKGRNSAVVTGSTGTNGMAYVVRAKSGQKLVLDVGPATKIGVKVETEGSYGHAVLLREERGGTYEVGLEETGDYTIFIGSLTNRPVSFSLKVAITKLTDI